MLLRKCNNLPNHLPQQRTKRMTPIDSIEFLRSQGLDYRRIGKLADLSASTIYRIHTGLVKTSWTSGERLIAAARQVALDNEVQRYVAARNPDAPPPAKCDPVRMRPRKERTKAVRASLALKREEAEKLKAAAKKSVAPGRGYGPDDI